MAHWNVKGPQFMALHKPDADRVGASARAARVRRTAAAHPGRVADCAALWKVVRLEEQMRYAAERGKLDRVDGFLRSLRLDEWLRVLPGKEASHAYGAQDRQVTSKRASVLPGQVAIAPKIDNPRGFALENRSDAELSIVFRWDEDQHIMTVVVQGAPSARLPRERPTDDLPH